MSFFIIWSIYPPLSYSVNHFIHLSLKKSQFFHFIGKYVPVYFLYIRYFCDKFYDVILKKPINYEKLLETFPLFTFFVQRYIPAGCRKIVHRIFCPIHQFRGVNRRLQCSLVPRWIRIRNFRLLFIPLGYISRCTYWRHRHYGIGLAGR